MKNVTVIGAGALGSHLILLLRNEAVMKVIDYDRVEQKNVLAQFHGKPSVGKSKTQSLQQGMQFLFGVKLTTIPHRLTSENVKELLGGSDLVVDCLDNAESRIVVQEFVRKANIPCLHGAMAADGVFGRVVWDANFVIDSEGIAGAPTCENGEHLPFIGIVSALLARAAQEFLKTGKKIGYEFHPGGVIRT
jgi:molybdopterin/thiamine biosynthesis adenylyltransferase